MIIIIIITIITTVVALDESEMEIFDVNVGGIIRCNKVAIMYMSKRKSQGIIINTASAAGKKNVFFLNIVI